MKYLLIIVIALIIIGGAIWGYKYINRNSYNSSTNTTVPLETSPSGSTVTIANMAFSPGNLTVSPGTTVTFRNNDSVAHTVMGDSFDSGSIAPGSSFTYTFNNAGTFAYHCTIHPSMQATITVTQ